MRAGADVRPDWGAVLTLTVASALAAVVGARLAARIDTGKLQAAFTVLVLVVAVFMAARALPGLV